jgi:hypothetical protein
MGDTELTDPTYEEIMWSIPPFKAITKQEKKRKKSKGKKRVLII